MIEFLTFLLVGGFILALAIMGGFLLIVAGTAVLTVLAMPFVWLYQVATQN